MPRVVHFEIHADDPDRAAKFYTDLFGWQVTKWSGPTDYWMIGTGTDGPGINGGMIRRQHPLTGTDGVIGYVNTVDVPDLDAAVAKGVGLGGAVALPKFQIAGVGWMAYLKDTEGNVFGLIQMDRKPA
jgi:predicted enzyme related to lactoylglutathione lyase